MLNVLSLESDLPCGVAELAQCFVECGAHVEGSIAFLLYPIDV